ncbi:MAG: hypothetical protein HFH68_14440 [Lachnospiraceae bacterium]|nr:hypothetical protein [Lachnospiraceae bacterium]
MMVRYGSNAAEKERLGRIKAEHELFKHSILSGTTQEIYGSCKKIYFYENIIDISYIMNR